MKTVEIICCLFIIIFAVAVSYPLYDKPFGDQVTKQNDGGMFAQYTEEVQLLPSTKLDSGVSEMSQEDINQQQDSHFSDQDTKEQKSSLSSYAYDQEGLDGTNAEVNLPEEIKTVNV